MNQGAKKVNELNELRHQWINEKIYEWMNLSMILWIYESLNDLNK